MRKIFLAVAVVLIVMAGLQPASAKTKTPSKVGLVSFTAASLNVKKKSASLSLDWPNASHAKKYQVYMSKSYSMTNVKKFTVKSSKTRITHLTPGKDYFFQVRGVNGKKVGAKSTRVGHTAIRKSGNNSGSVLRVMSYNVCSQFCSSWTTRQPGVLARVAAYQPDILAAQEAPYLTVPPGYAQAVYMSAKRLMFKTSRFDIAQATDASPVLPAAAPVGSGCFTSTTSYGHTPADTKNRTGYIYLGYHGDVDSRGCRYAVWSELVDKTNGKHILAVDVHTVSGTKSNRALDRRAEITTLLSSINAINNQDLPVVYAGDFNSHKDRAGDLGTVFNSAGYYDAYDLAMKFRYQHYNTYNGFHTTPVVSYKWGDHLDHVWVAPQKGRVLSWTNGVYIKNKKLVTPIPSDHSPLVVDLQIN